MGKALYRKYRPVTLGEVVGQEQVTKTLESSIKQGKISHSYLFTGPRGTGKTSIARIFAHKINGFSYEIEDSYLDIIEIDAASNTGVDNIRELREKSIIAPSQGKFKVYIIDEVHMLSKSAFNALLKTLEEPPEHVVFIMATTELNKVPITITSRSQTYTFKLADQGTMINHLSKIAEKEKISIEKDALKIIANRSGGSFRDALSLLDQISTLSDENITAKDVADALGLPQDQTITQILAAYTENDDDKITKLLKDILSTGIKPEVLAEEVIKKIVNEPTPELLPLLEKLPSVQGNFPEAKLLVAFLNGAQIAVPQKKTETLKTPKTEKPSFNWSNFVEKVKEESSAVGAMLESFDHNFDGNKLQIFPSNIGTQKIISSKRNQEILKKCLGNLEYSIESQERRTKDQSLDKISDIMGSVQEVKQENDDSNIPF